MQTVSSGDNLLLHTICMKCQNLFCREISGEILPAENFTKSARNFSQKTGLDISCKLSPVETICMKCQNQL